MEVNVLLEAALLYASKGWQVIPLYGVVGSVCECGKGDCSSQGKHPRGKWKEMATTDPEIIRAWWEKWPKANVGIVTGNGTDIVVIDVDGPEGDAAFRRLCAENNFIPETLTAHTGKGRHHYFLHPGVDIPNSTRTVADGVDVRGDGGYIVAPPSVHRNGRTYTWQADDQPLQELPNWLLRAMLVKKRKDSPETRGASTEPIPQGRRNTELTSIAGRLRQRGLGEPEILQALLKENDTRCQPPLDTAEVQSICRSISRYPSGGGFGATEVDAPGGEPGKGAAERLIQMAAGRCHLFHDPDGEAYATMVRNGKSETWAIRSGDFKAWLTHQYWDEVRTAPSSKAMTDALAVIAARAKFDGETHKVFTRVGEYEGAIYIDLANKDRQVIEVTPSGWHIISEPPVKFRRPKGMRQLPDPAPGGDLNELRPFLNIGSEEDWMMMVAWLLAALRPQGPYPLAALHGEQGSAKTTTARVLRALVDPNMAPVRCEPRDGRDLMISATNGWTIALDNLSRVTDSLSDALCRLSTGGGFATRTLYTDTDETILEAQRPVVLTGIEDLATRSDLLDRSLVIYLPRIRSSQRMTERQFWTSFNAAQPRIFGALLTVVAGALAELPEVDLGHLPRLADFATWMTAAEPALGWEDGSFLKAFIGNRYEGNAVALEASPLSAPITKLVEKSAIWSGTAEQLLRRLEALVAEPTLRHREWPRTARAVSGALRRLAPCLLPTGVKLEFGRNNTRDRSRIITITRLAPSGSSASSAIQPGLVN